MNIQRHTGALKTSSWSNVHTTIYKNSLKCQSGQMSMQRPTCILKTSIWSNGYTSTHGNPSEPSIYSFAYTVTYRFLRNAKVVKCVYHDIQEPVKWQFGQMNLRRHTGTRKMLIWSNEFTTTYRNPLNVNLVK